MRRELRHWFTSRVTEAALAVAPRLSDAAIGRLRRFVRAAAPRLPRLAPSIARNMATLGVYSPEVLRAHFDQVSAHLTGVVTFLHHHDARRSGPSDAYLQHVRDVVHLDDSFAALGDLAAAGRGAVVMGPHLANFVTCLPRINMLAPLTIYMRPSRLAARHEAKIRWCRTAGMSWIIEPPEQKRRPHGRLAGMTAAVRSGRVVYITPDLVRKRGDGAAVRFFDREIYLPAGAAVLAARAAAPLFILVGESDGATWRLSLRGPAAPTTAHDDSGVRAAVQRCMQWLADEFEQFVRRQPALWYSWADKRWTRLLRGDPDYSTLLRTPPSDDDTSLAPAGAG